MHQTRLGMEKKTFDLSTRGSSRVPWVSTESTPMEFVEDIHQQLFWRSHTLTQSHNEVHSSSIKTKCMKTKSDSNSQPQTTMRLLNRIAAKWNNTQQQRNVVRTETAISRIEATTRTATIFSFRIVKKLYIRQILFYYYLAQHQNDITSVKVAQQEVRWYRKKINI